MLQQPRPIAQRLANKLDVQTFQVAQTAVDHLRRGGRRLRSGTAAFEDGDRIPLSSKLPGDAGTVDPPPTTAIFTVKSYLA